MRLQVRVTEARNIPAMDPNGLSDPYVKIQLGRQKFKTKVVKKSLNPQWGEEFGFRVDDLNEELVVYVLDEDKYFNDDFVGQLKVPVSKVFDSEDKSIGPCWYSLQPKHKKSKNKDCGMLSSVSGFVFFFAVVVVVFFFFGGNWVLKFCVFSSVSYKSRTEFFSTFFDSS